MTEDRSLPALMKDQHALDELLFETDGQINEVMEQWFDENQMAIKIKVDGYKHRMNHLKAVAGEMADQEKMYYKYKKICENEIDRMKSVVRHVMETLKVKELSGNMFRFNLNAPKDSLVIENEAAVPAIYTMETTTISLDKEKIKADLKEGKKVPGCKLETTYSLNSYPNVAAKKKKELENASN